MVFGDSPGLTSIAPDWTSGASLIPSAQMVKAALAHQIAAQLNGREEESVAAGQRAKAVSGGHSFPIGYAVVGHVRFGRLTEARAAQARLLDLAASTSCTVTRTRLPDRRTLPSSTVPL